MSAPDMLERTRMALAEAGYPDANIWLDPTDGPCVSLVGPGSVPDEVTWRAHSVAAVDPTSVPCWSCWDKGTPDACLADRPLVRDCGVTR